LENLLRSRKIQWRLSIEPGFAGLI
jgi:hypothetical protein